MPRRAARWLTFLYFCIGSGSKSTTLGKYLKHFGRTNLVRWRPWMFLIQEIDQHVSRAHRR